jgi:hypothetical protein
MARIFSGAIAIFLLVLYAYGVWILRRNPDKEPTPQASNILGLL